jgi:hypothetical protein
VAIAHVVKLPETRKNVRKGSISRKEIFIHGSNFLHCLHMCHNAVSLTQAPMLPTKQVDATGVRVYIRTFQQFFLKVSISGILWLL